MFSISRVWLENAYSRPQNWGFGRSNETRAPIANPPNNAHLGGSPYHSSKLHPGPSSSVDVRPRIVRQTHRQTHTDTQTRVTAIHFASFTKHAKCNNEHKCLLRHGCTSKISYI